MSLSFYRWRDNDYYLADLVVFIDGEQHVLGTYKLARTAGELRWRMYFTPTGGEQTLIGQARSLAEAKKGANANAARRVYAFGSVPR